MYKRRTPLDNFVKLWYHVTVKLGCYAMTPGDLAHGSDRLATDMSESVCDGSFASLFSMFGRGGVSYAFKRPDLPTYVSPFSAEHVILPAYARYRARESACPSAGRAGYGGCAGRARGGISAMRVC